MIKGLLILAISMVERVSPLRRLARWAVNVLPIGIATRLMQARFDATSRSADHTASGTSESPLFAAGTPEKNRKARVYLDVTNTAKTDAKSGIQRVSRNIVSALYLQDKHLLEPWAVTLGRDGKLHAANHWLRRNGFLPAWRHDDPDGPVDFLPGDIYLQLDLLMGGYEDRFEPILAAMRQSGVGIAMMVYDILAIRMPECFNSHWQKPFWRGMPQMERWLHYVAGYADVVVAISRSVRDDVRQWIAENHSQRMDEIAFVFSHLGADIQNFDFANRPQSKQQGIPDRSYLLMVGTIEIRKNHALALEAMDTLWERGIDLALCVAGKEGWLAEPAMRRLRKTDGKRLYFFEQATDEELRALYANAKGLLFVSKGEGFGLPLIEAARYGTPIVCSDLPVFHEIAGDFATYVRISDAACLAEDIATWWERAKQGSIPDSSKMSRLTWEESSHQLLSMLASCATQRSSSLPITNEV